MASSRRFTSTCRSSACAAASSVRSHLRKLRNEGVVWRRRTTTGGIAERGTAMRTATAVLVASTAAMLRSRAYGMGPGGEIASLPGLRGAHDAPARAATVIAGDAASADPVTADGLGGGLPASGATAIPPAPPAPGEQLVPRPIRQPRIRAIRIPPPTRRRPAIRIPPPTRPRIPSRPTTRSRPMSRRTFTALQDFVNQGLDESPLGVELREDCSRLKSHEKVCGLAVLEVRNGSPADKAGIKRYTALTHDLLAAPRWRRRWFSPAIVAGRRDRSERDRRIL